MALAFSVSRYLLGVILLATSIGKLLDVPGFVQVIGTYQALPEVVVPLVAVCIVLLELKLSEGFLFYQAKSLGLQRVALASAFLHLLFSVLAIVTLLRGIELQNCGCFGVFLARPLSWQTPVEDFVLVAISLFVFRFSFRSKDSAE